MPRRSSPSNAGTPPPSAVRLQRALADAGVASRRDCEKLIEAGAVEVNGERVQRLPVFIDPAVDRVRVDGQPIRLRRPGDSRRGTSAERVYIMLHKPSRVLSTTIDDSPEGGGSRTTVLDLVRHPSGARLYPVGRLDYHSTGLVLLTNDGQLAERLTHARYGVTRTYRVTMKGRPNRELIEDIQRRIAAERPEVPAVIGRIGRGGARPTGPSDSGPLDAPGVRIVREAGSVADSRGSESPNAVLEITLREGKSRQLTSVLEQMGALVKKLTRVGIGPLRLRGVAVGQWRNLTRDEVAALRQSAGLSRSGSGTSRGKTASGVVAIGSGPRTAPRSKPLKPRADHPMNRAGADGRDRRRSGSSKARRGKRP